LVITVLSLPITSSIAGRKGFLQLTPQGEEQEKLLEPQIFPVIEDLTPMKAEEAHRQSSSVVVSGPEL
jgi:hypothetical protein